LPHQILDFQWNPVKPGQTDALSAGPSCSACPEQLQHLIFGNSHIKVRTSPANEDDVLLDHLVWIVLEARFAAIEQHP
jgi:hypothetical protein